MKGFEGNLAILAIDNGKPLAIVLCSATITNFIYSPFDTPATASGGVIVF
jgi:hypothetical protein